MHSHVFVDYYPARKISYNPTMGIAFSLYQDIARTATKEEDIRTAIKKSHIAYGFLICFYVVSRLLPRRCFLHSMQGMWRCTDISLRLQRPNYREKTTVIPAQAGIHNLLQ